MEDEAMIKAMDAFGGGLGSHGEVCGAIIGGLCVLGSIFGRSKPESQKDGRMRQYSDIFMKRSIGQGRSLAEDGAVDSIASI